VVGDRAPGNDARRLVDRGERRCPDALGDEGQGRVGTSFERVILRCFSWDPASRRYRVFLTRYFRGAGLVLLAAVGTLLAVLWRRDLRRRPA